MKYLIKTKLFSFKTAEWKIKNKNDEEKIHRWRDTNSQLHCHWPNALTVSATASYLNGHVRFIITNVLIDKIYWKTWLTYFLDFPRFWFSVQSSAQSGWSDTTIPSVFIHFGYTLCYTSPYCSFVKWFITLGTPFAIPPCGSGAIRIRSTVSYAWS